MDKISSGVITLAIVGKPNVGKSTFFNKVLNKDLSPVSEIPGTTKDLFIDNVSYKNRTFKLIDSGGLKRKGKSKSDEQQYITKESLKAIYLADVVLFMIEADKEFTKTDKQICRLVLDKGKGLIFVWSCRLSTIGGTPPRTPTMKLNWSGSLRSPMSMSGQMPSV